MGGNCNGDGGFNKNNGSGKNEFTGFKPKELRTLSDSDRKKVVNDVV